MLLVWWCRKVLSWVLLNLFGVCFWMLVWMCSLMGLGLLVKRVGNRVLSFVVVLMGVGVVGWVLGVVVLLVGGMGLGRLEFIVKWWIGLIRGRGWDCCLVVCCGVGGMWDGCIVFVVVIIVGCCFIYVECCYVV